MLLLVLVMAGLARGAVLCARFDQLKRDPDSYRAYARSLVEHGDFLRNGRPSAWRPPLYPLVLAACLAAPLETNLAIALVHWTLGLGTVAMTGLLARRLELGRVAWLAALLVALDPILLYESTEIMTETLATFLAVTALYALAKADSHDDRRWSLAAGLLVGLAGLTRPTLLIWGAIVIAGLAVRASQRWRALAVAAGLVVSLAPWTTRNLIELGRPVVATTHGGYTLLLGNNPFFYEFLRQRKPGAWDSSQFNHDWHSRLMSAGIDSEVKEDAFAYKLARANIAGAPASFARACWNRARAFWQLAPRAVGERAIGFWQRAAIATWYLAVYALAALGAIKIVSGRRGQLWLPAVGLALALFAAHLLYWCDMRMRAPAAPALALSAAAGASALVARARSRK